MDGFGRLSEAEVAFVVGGVQDGVRSDGRGCVDCLRWFGTAPFSCDDVRPWRVERGVVAGAAGSARARVGRTDVLAGVKAELSAGAPSLHFFVDCSANAAPRFEGRGGEEWAVEAAGALSTAYAAVELSALREGDELGWQLFVDVVVLQCGGAVVDAASVAAKAALADVRLPTVAVEGTRLDAVTEEGASKAVDVSSAPCLLAVGKLGWANAVDLGDEEEACCRARLLVAVTPSCRVTLIRQVGGAALEMDSLTDMVDVAVRAVSRLHAVANEASGPQSSVK